MSAMGEIRIFDSLTHPTPTGNWLDSSHDGAASAHRLVEQMKQCGVDRALAVGMGASVGGYEESAYARWVLDAVPGSVPIAFMTFDDWDHRGSLTGRLEHLRDLGYRGVKVHPRFTGLTFTDKRFIELLASAAEHDLPVLICSYNVGHPRYAAGDLSPARLVEAIDATPGGKTVVLHGGGRDVLEWSEWLRTRDDVLLDLSFTLARYAGSSVDLDLQHLFRVLDQRLCVGSDHPQYELTTLRSRFDLFADGIPRDNAERIAFGNLARFFPAGNE
jgi:hypothetical protein